MRCQYRRQAGDVYPAGQVAPISATGKHVIVIGGGDTGSDCIGTSLRQGAKSVINLELFPEPPSERPNHQPWPFWPMRLRTSSSHEEGGRRQWQVLTKAFEGKRGDVHGLRTVAVEFEKQSDGPPKMHEVPGSEQSLPARERRGGSASGAVLMDPFRSTLTPLP